jgi:mediator of RNA polymerase II transcription subunit 6
MNNRIYQSPDVYTVLSNRLLASISALQSSLDILCKHRPDYTPRTGFVWPITDPSIEDPTKRQAAEGEFSLTESETTEVANDNRKEAPKRQQNNWLLMNAMRTTAAHSKMSFSSSFVQTTDNLAAVADTSAATTMRSSPTPAPEQVLKVPSISQEPSKGPVGSGKKKRKRTSLAPPPATTST